MIKRVDDYILLLRDKGDSLRLSRVFAKSMDAVIPDTVEGIAITEIGSYCFAAARRLNVEEEHEISEIDTSVFHEYAGEYVRQLSIGDSVTQIGNTAFYNCRKLAYIDMGRYIEDIGSDVFMNCISLKKISVRCNVNQRSGVKQVLDRISAEVEVDFVDGGRVSGRLLYPEYVESYDEIAPAHIFGRNIVGEGFRARQCFTDGVPDMGHYDAVFNKASAEETVDVAIRMAFDRMMYPYDLDEKHESEYHCFLSKQHEEAIKCAIKCKDIDKVYFLLSRKIVDKNYVDTAAAIASDEKWTEGAASIISWKKQFYNIKENRYSFDDF